MPGRTQREPYPGGLDIPLSHAQESIWFLCRLASDTAVYNLPAAVRLRGDLNVEALRGALETIVARHDILRTTFPARDGAPVQKVHERLELPLEVVDASALTAEQRVADLALRTTRACRSPFDLEGGPLFRLLLLRSAPDEHLLLTVFHHIVWDGWSIGVFVSELGSLYEAAVRNLAPALPTLSLQYGEYARREREELCERIESRLDWWRDALRGHGPLELPTDRVRPAVQTYSGATLPLRLSPDLAHRLEAFSHQAEATPYITLLTAFATLLSRWSAQKRFVIGTPVANRARRELAPLIGYFANLMPVPLDLAGDPSFAELLRRTKVTATAAYTRQDLPFDVLVDGIGASGDPSRNPVFQIVFALHQESLESLSMAEVEVEPVFLESTTTHFDLALHLWRRPDAVHGYFSFNTDLFDRATVARLARQFQMLLEAALERPELPVSELRILDATERAVLETRAKGGAHPEESGSLLVERLARRFRDSDAAPVLVGSSSELGASLRARIDGLVDALRDEGVRAGLGVGVAATDALDWAVALQAIWALDAVAVPINRSECTSERDRLLSLAGASAWVEVVAPGDLDVGSASAPAGARPSAGDVAWRSLASGSPMEHSFDALATMVAAVQRHLPLGRDDVVCGLSAGTAPHAFAIESLWPLTAGARVTDSADEATVLHATPLALARWLGRTSSRPSRLRAVVCSGGYLSAELAESARGRLGCTVVYLYTPPEAAGVLTADRFDGSIPSGELLGAGPPIMPVSIREPGGGYAPVGVPGTIWSDDCPTGDRGRWLDGGALQLLGPTPGRLWRDGSRWDLDRIRRALIAHPSVRACHVAVRGIEPVAWVVGPASIDAAGLVGGLALPSGLTPAVTVVSGLPLDDEGRVDEAALRRLPMIDADLAARWEAGLMDRAGVDRAHVVVRPEREPERRRLHLDDITPGWRGSGGGLRTTTATSGAAPPPNSMPCSTSRGAPLQPPDDAPSTLVDALERVAARWGDERGLTVVDSSAETEFLSYRRLLERARGVAGGMRAGGLGPGSRVVLQMDSLADHFVALWGCLLAGVAPVGVATAPSWDEPNAVLAKLWNVWGLLGEPPVVVSESLLEPLQGAARLYGARPSLVAFEDLERHPAADPQRPSADDVVFIQLTSGSTGVPKCIPETHRAILAHTWGTRQMHRYTDDDVSLNWLPLDHVVPVLTCHLRDTVLGLPQIHVRTERVLVDPLVWLDLMEAHGVTLSWAPNFGFKLVNDALAAAVGRQWDLSRLRWVMNAGEQVTLSVAAGWTRNLAPFGVRPEVMQPAFGMAESATCVAYANDFCPDGGARTVRRDSLGGVLVDAAGPGPETMSFVDLGPPIPGAEFRIAGPDGGVLPESVIGRLQLRGPMVMTGYLNNPEANAEAFVGDGWFDSGDLGFVHRGRLTVTGRSKEMIVVRGANLYCYDIEAVVDAVPGVTSTWAAVCAVDDPATGTEGVAVFFVPEGGTAEPDLPLINSVRQAVARDFGVAPTYVVPLARDTFPKTTSGKIQRTRLKQALARGTFDSVLRRVEVATGEHTVPDWFLTWNWRRAVLSVRGPLGGEIVVVDAGGPEQARSPLTSAILDSLPPSGVERFSPADLASFLEKRSGDSRRLTVFLAEPDPAAVVALAPVLAEAGPGTRIVIACTNAVFADGTEVVDPDRAGLRGLPDTASIEWPGVDVILVDVTHEADPGAALLAEAAAEAGDSVVAWRGGTRLVPRLRRAHLGVGKAGSPSSGPHLQEGDLVLVAGGLGGVGGEVCRHLLTHYGVRLLVTGRSLVEEIDVDGGGDRSAAGQETLGRAKDLSERLATLRQLQAHGDVLYRAVDVTDQEEMGRALADAEHLFQTKCRGAIHLAGVFPARLLAEETVEGLAATLAPKLEGARCLDALLPPDALLVLFGSVFGSFGAAGCGGYAVANAALEGFARSRPGPTRMLSWSNWADLGMSRGFGLEAASLGLGFDMISSREGVASFDAALQSGDEALLIGLDCRRPNVSRYLDDEPRPLQRLVGYHTPPSEPAALSKLSVLDRSGRPVPCHFVAMDELPVDAQGTVDERLLESEGGVVPGDAVLPQTSAERTVAAVWQEILELDTVDIDANFFSLGGQSILLLRVLSRLERSFGRPIPVVDLFRYPTIRLLAAFLSEAAPARRTLDRATERADRQRAATLERPRPRPRRRP